MQKYPSKVFHGTLLILIAILCINMTGGVEKAQESPEFIELKEKAGSFAATIDDGTHKTNVTKLSFSGHTKLDGIKNEKRSSFATLDLAELKEIKIENPTFLSDKYKTEEFIKASVTTLKNKNITNVLIPQKTIICGRGEIPQAWYLKDIKKITINHDKKKVVKDIVEKQEKGWWQRMKDFLNI